MQRAVFAPLFTNGSDATLILMTDISQLMEMSQHSHVFLILLLGLSKRLPLTNLLTAYTNIDGFGIHIIFYRF